MEVNNADQFYPVFTHEKDSFDGKTYFERVYLEMGRPIGPLLIDVADEELARYVQVESEDICECEIAVLMNNGCAWGYLEREK